MVHKYVFISHSSTDKAIADATCHILEEYGIPCWISSRNIVPGKTWAGNIVQAIRNCNLMVLIYTKYANNSSQVANEVNKAFSYGKIIIPFIVDSTPMNDDFDYYLSRKHWLIAFPNYREMLLPLVEAVATNIGVKIHQPQTSTNNIKAASIKGAPIVYPQYKAAMEIARKALMSYNLDTAFAELIRPALDDYKEAQFLIRTILTTSARMKRLNSFHFKYVKEKADTGNAFAQYIMSRYNIYIDCNNNEAYRYANLCAAQQKSYGYLELSMVYRFAISVERDNLRAHELLNKAVNMDDPFAILQMAKDNLNGWTYKRNPKWACTLLKRCMDMHIPESFVVMGNMYNKGNGVECDKQRALELYHQALDEGYLEAYNNIACCYIYSQNEDDTEIQQGISLLRKGIEYGVAECLSTLALCYETGTGFFFKKIEQALRLYKKAAEAGDPDAFFYVGCMYLNKDNTEAWKWLVRGTKILSSSCFCLLGIMCQEGFGQEGKTVADCVGYYEEVLHLGGSHTSVAALQLYDIFRTSSLETNPLMWENRDIFCDYDWAPKDDCKAISYLKQAADMGDSDPQIYFKYGAILCTEGHVFTDEFEGIHYLELAVQKGEPRAAVMLAQIYEQGELVDQNIEKAREYYQLAADKDFGDGYVGLANRLCEQIMETAGLWAQIMGTADELNSDFSNLDESTKRKFINQIYEYVCKADELGCKAVCPLEYSMPVFMATYELLTPIERNRLLEMNEKYARLGNSQCIVNRGMMFQMGRFTEPNIYKAIETYQQATRLNEMCAAQKLGALYAGNEEGLPAQLQDKPTAVYWYEKDFSRISHDISTLLQEEGHQIAIDFELVYNQKKESEYIKWVFPYLCDPAFAPTSRLRIFEWADFAEGPLADEKPQDADIDIRYLPRVVDDLFKNYVKMYNLLKNTYECSDFRLPKLNKEDFFPYISIPHLLELGQMVYQAWNIHIKHGNEEWLQQHAEEMKLITLMSLDWDAILKLAEKVTNTDLQLLLIGIVEMRCGLEALAFFYWQLIALNDLVENDGNVDFHLPEEFVKGIADQFFDGTEVLPRSRVIARRLYAKISYMPGIKERLKQ